jgi:hypothetical protein
MSIQAECPACGNRGPVPESYQGRLVRCPRCKGAFQIAAAATNPAAAPSSSAKPPALPPAGGVPPVRRAAPTPPRPAANKEEIIEAEILAEEEEEHGGAYAISDSADTKPKKETRENSGIMREPPLRRRRPEDDQEDREEDDEHPAKGPDARRTMEEEYGDTDDDDDDRYSSRRLRQKRRKGEYSASRWDKVHLGLLLLFIGWCVFAGGFALQTLALIITIIKLASGSLTNGNVVEFFLKAGQILLLGGGICSLVGYGFCLAIPTNKRGCLGLAIAGTVLASLNVIFGFIYGLLPQFETAAVGRSKIGSVFVVGFPFVIIFLGAFKDLDFIPILLGLLFQAEVIVVAIFLWAVAHFWKSLSVAGSSMRLVILAGINAGVDLFIVFLPKMAPSGGSDSFKWIVWIVLILRNLSVLAQLIWFNLNIKGARDSID